MKVRRPDLLDQDTVAEIKDLVADDSTAVTAAKRRMVEKLRRLEDMSRLQMNSRQELQVIMSARRLLGDRESLGMVHGLFADGPARL
ncbi:hypothetical protein [Methylobacterium sp. ID0610]|uniref:hypothetical protein n=1 Tax=Methylobacterium carpenticola TaxID=3344827 RepID=UPI00368A9EC8